MPSFRKANAASLIENNTCVQYTVQKWSKSFKFSMYIGSVNGKIVYVILRDIMTPPPNTCELPNEKVDTTSCATAT